MDMDMMMHCGPFGAHQRSVGIHVYQPTACPINDPFYVGVSVVEGTPQKGVLHFVDIPLKPPKRGASLAKRPPHIHAQMPCGHGKKRAPFFGWLSLKGNPSQSNHCATKRGT